MPQRDESKMDPAKLRLMRIADSAAKHDFSLAGRKKEGGYARRKPSLPPTPWDDKPEQPEE